MKPVASIIVINYNGKKFIKKCLNSVLKTKGVSCEILVVDNGSTDKSDNIVKKFTEVTFIKSQTNLGPAKARNAASLKAKGKYLVFLDYDTVVNPSWLKEVVDYLDKDESLAGGQLKIMRMDKSGRFDSIGEKITRSGFLVEMARGAVDNGQFENPFTIFSGKTAAMIIKKDIFSKIKGFDEDIFMYWEEPDLCWRVWKSGYILQYLPMGEICHAYGTERKPVSKSHSNWVTYQGCKNQITVIFKNAIGLYLLTMLTGVIWSWFALLFLFAIKGNFEKVNAILKAFLWHITHLKYLHYKRALNKTLFGKKFSNDSNFAYQVFINRKITWYLGKCFSYLFSKPF